MMFLRIPTTTLPVCPPLPVWILFLQQQSPFYVHVICKYISLDSAYGRGSAVFAFHFSLIFFSSPPSHIHPKPSLWLHFPEGNSLVGSIQKASTCVHSYVHACEYTLQGPFIFAHMHISRDWPLGTGQPLWELIPGGNWSSLSLSSHWPPEVLHLGMG